MRLLIRGKRLKRQHITGHRFVVRTDIKAFYESIDHHLLLEKHPDKTFIGRIEKGFDFLGYHFSNGGLTVAAAAIQRFREHCQRLYKQKLCQILFYFFNKL